MEQRLACPIPFKLKRVLEDCGYDNHISMSKITEDIFGEELQKEGMTMVPPIKLASGHWHLIERLGTECKKGISKVPAALTCRRRQTLNHRPDSSESSSSAENVGKQSLQGRTFFGRGVDPGGRGGRAPFPPSFSGQGEGEELK